jgi:dihydroorotate dehydrogenase
MYGALRPWLFLLEPERAHELSLRALRAAERLRLIGRTEPARPATSRRVMGLEFPNRVGLAAGFDKNGSCIDALAGLGFGFIEIGTLTPAAQPGNPRPRLFRVPRAHALINRMGFPNVGAAAACARLKERRRSTVLGINIGKNAATPVSRAVDDYLAALRTVYPYADYIAINVSSPNTAGLRELEQPERLGPLLQALLEARAALLAGSSRHVPLLVKLSPDLSAADLEATARTLAALHVDGVIATNSTVQREAGATLREAGGLSGAPLLPLSTHTVHRLRALLGPGFPIIGVGGIDSPQSARAMLDAGADLIQIYTGLIYRGPRLPRLLSQL